MKKVIMLFAVAFSAIVMHAATVNWSVNNVQAPGGGSATAGWLVQIFDSSVAYDYEAAKAGTITALDSAAVTLSGTVMKASGSGITKNAGDAVNVYAVVYDAATVDGAANYIVSAVTAKNMPANGSNLSLAFGNMAGTTTANLFKDATFTSTGGGGVPEPTSGLLLLVGGALLALRRKQK